MMPNISEANASNMSMSFLGGNPMKTTKQGLQLTEEEAFALLDLVMTSTHKLDAIQEGAMRKLAKYCTQSSNPRPSGDSELEAAG